MFKEHNAVYRTSILNVASLFVQLDMVLLGFLLVAELNNVGVF
jgi:hypothetical protein